MRYMEKMLYQEISLFEWHKMLSDITEDMEGNEQPGYLVTMKSDNNVRNVVRTDGCLGIRMISVEVDVRK
jgi:hypothetical protein